MRKILLLALPLMVMCIASCNKWTDDSPIIQFKDQRFLEVLIASDYPKIDKNEDGQISEKEASVIETLYASYSGIRNINEIKYFTALEHFHCQGNLFTELDLSENTTLTELWCQGNQLTSLDLSKNTSLTYLDCSGNQLTSLDLSKNTSLTYLSCGDNQLTSLDLSKNTTLTELYCFNNQLTSLDLSNNTALTNLGCSGNPLAKLILYKYHMLYDTHIRDIIEEYGNIIEYVE